MNTIRYYIILLVLCSCLWVQAQNPVYRVINNLNGLSSNTIYSVLQDKKGFVWVAHDKGLSRYDGKSFVHYESIAKQGRSLFNLMEYQNVIYCQDFAGNFYYTCHDRLIQEPSLIWKGGFMPSAIINTQQLMSCIADTLRIFDLQTKKIKKIKIKDYFNWGISASNNHLLALCANGLYKTDGVKGTFMPLNTYNSFFITATSKEVYGISKNHYPYIRRLLHGGRPVEVLKPNIFVQDVVTLADEIWVLTSSGAYCFDHDFKPKYGGFCFFEGVSISKLMKDREGCYWFATLNRGIFFVPNISFRLYQYQQLGLTALADYQQGEGVLIGTETQKLLTFGKQRQFQVLFNDKASNHEIISIFEDEASHELMFCSNRLVLLNRHYGVNNILEMAAKSITKIQENLYAVAYSGGVYLLNRSSQKMAVPRWLQNTKHESSIAANSPYALTQSAVQSRSRYVAFSASDTTLYVATIMGVAYFSPKGQGFITNRGSHIYGSQIITEGHNTYVSTFSEGLLILQNQKVIRQISRKDGLASNTIYRFKKDQQTLWLLEEGMLQAYHLPTGQTMNYSSIDGLPRAEIKDIAVGKQQVFLATTDGLAVFDKHIPIRNTTRPLISLTKFTVNDQLRDYNGPLELNADQNSIGIYFSVLSFKSEDELKINYRINEGKWLSLPAQSRMLSFPSLSFGSYRLQIRVFNEDGLMTKQPLELQFRINAPFYWQGWFIGLVLILLTVIIYSYFQWRINDIKQKNQLIADKLQLEQAVKQSILTSIRSQMNPHFLFNALNTIQAYIYTNDKENASVYLGKFSELTRRILDMSNKDSVPLSEEIKSLTLYLDLEKIRFEDLLSYTIEIDPDLQPDFVYIPPMLIQPYVENAIKHGLLHKRDNRQVWLRFRKEIDCLLVIIEDNGIGRKRSGELKKLKEKKHESFAISANQKRLEILNQGAKYSIMMEIIDKQNNLGEAMGTLVNIRIPLMKSSANVLVK